MKINTPAEKYIFIELSRSDMEKLNLRYKDMDYSDEATRKAIYSVLDSARVSLGQDFKLSDTVKVEALPRDDGGCFLFFTIRKKNEKYHVIKNGSIYLCAEKIDSLFDFCSALDKSECEKVKASLYICEGKYYLHLFGSLHSRLIAKACEYAGYIRSDEFEALGAERVIEDIALKILGGSVSES